MRGFYLQGGGAKGAFQAGVIKGLYEKGIKPDVIAGTSIGAVNAYFMFTGNIKKMESFWLNIDNNSFSIDDLKGDVVDNSLIIDKLLELEGRDKNIKEFYVNYVNVKNSKLYEKVEDIVNKKKEDRLDIIKWSSLLPFIKEESFSTKEIFEKFEEKVKLGKYNGYNLDGGILNNNFISSLLKRDLKEIYCLGLSKKYNISGEIYKKISREKVCIIKPEFDFSSTDTLNFEKNFCKELFNHGHNESKKILK